MTATVRIGTCSWADEGLLKAWYPRGVSTAEARLRFYAERFDVVEVDSPYYALPDPAVTERWARRTRILSAPGGSPSESARACRRRRIVASSRRLAKRASCRIASVNW